MKEFVLNQTYCKVLLTISRLNQKSFYPLNEGIYKVLAGVDDEEAFAFNDLETFGTLTSYSSKKICHLTLMLFRHDYIGKIFDPKSKKLYFRITEKGEKALADFLNKHHRVFVKKKAKVAQTIVKIV